MALPQELIRRLQEAPDDPVMYWGILTAAHYDLERLQEEVTGLEKELRKTGGPLSMELFEGNDSEEKARDLEETIKAIGEGKNIENKRKAQIALNITLYNIAATDKEQRDIDVEGLKAYDRVIEESPLEYELTTEPEETFPELGFHESLSKARKKELDNQPDKMYRETKKYLTLHKIKEEETK